MLKKNKAISIVLAFVFCMSFLVPGLVAPQAAEAATTYETLTAPNITTDTAAQTLGSVKVDIPDKRVLPKFEGNVATQAYWEYLTISLPSGCTFASDSIPAQITKVNESLAGPTPELIVVGKKTSSTTWDMMIAYVDNPAFDDNKADFIIDFDKITVKSGSGNIDATFLSSGSVFPTGTATIAKIGDGSTQYMAKSVVTIGDAGGDLDTLVIRETIPGVLKGGDKIKLKLPNGFSWGSTTNTFVKGAWGFTGQNNAAVGETGDKDSFILEAGSSDRELILKLVNGTFVPSTNKTTAGRINIGCDSNFLKVNVDDIAKLGEIEVNISSETNSDVADGDVIVAKYGDYGITVSEKDSKDVVAGHNEQAIGSFYIEEDLVGSLVADRAIYLELPAGVKWDKLPQVKTEDGDQVLDNTPFTIVSNSGCQKIKATVKDITRGDAAKLLIEKGEVYVQPGFNGDISIKVSGSAGAEGTVKVAQAVKAVEFTAEDAPDIVIGEQGVKAANMIIKENQKGAIKEDANIVVALDGGYKFFKEPQVKVTEGDLDINDVDINSNNELVIEIDTESTKASTIEISEVYLTGYRYAPEGSVVAKLVEAEGTGATDATVTGSTALDSLYGKNADGTNKETKDMKYSEKSAGNVVIANCVTPAETSGTATFKINSNIYTLNGVSKVMDVAPYIKGDRTYMPVRYVAYAVGLTDADVVWDAATQKVTLTKGDTVVEMTIGSTTITVNGEAKTMDVAPEISNSRTMLPARFVAEAFGFQVGWDAATQTIIVSK